MAVNWRAMQEDHLKFDGWIFGFIYLLGLNKMWFFASFVTIYFHLMYYCIANYRAHAKCLCKLVKSSLLSSGSDFGYLLYFTLLYFSSGCSGAYKNLPFWSLFETAMLSANDLCTQYLRICSCKLLYHFLPTIDISRAELLEIVVCFSSPWSVFLLVDNVWRS